LHNLVISDQIGKDEQDREFVTVEELAILLRVNKKTVYDAIRKNKIPGCKKVGRQFRIHYQTFFENSEEGQGCVSDSEGGIS